MQDKKARTRKTSVAAGRGPMWVKPIRSCVGAAVGFLGVLLGTNAAAAGDQPDFGRQAEALLAARAERLFGIAEPLDASFGGHVRRRPGQAADDLLLLARGLEARIVTRDAANRADMLTFWPDAEAPTHLVWCVEGGRGKLDSGKFNPSVQRMDLATGSVETVLRGMDYCDGIRRTPWGTALVSEETDDGGAYEILDPLQTTELTLRARGDDRVVDTHGDAVPGRLAYRGALPTLAWEGLTVLPNGVVIAGDELRPGTIQPDADGGAIYKFIPRSLHDGTAVDSLTQSPLAAGEVYALQVDCKEPVGQTGQGCQVGNASWVAVKAGKARYYAHNIGATGYYRPEDLHRDPGYAGNGIRFCWAKTGNAQAENDGEILCAVDPEPESPYSVAVVSRFIEGNPDFNSLDNLAFQPHTGILYVTEDHDNGDVWACLPDGADRDLASDGCVKVLSLKDASAEPTGFVFAASGASAYLVIQHSDDRHMPSVDGHRTDDIVAITGFRIPAR